MFICRGSNDGEKAEGFTEEQQGELDDITLQRKKNDSFSKFDTDEDEEDPDKALKAIESPDELEALETLNEKVDSSIIDKGGTIDIDSLPAALSPMSPHSDEAFKLRYNIRNYKRMSSSSQGSQPEDDDIWVKMPPRGARGKQIHTGVPRPLSAEVTGHPHFSKLPLARSSSENFQYLGDMNDYNIRTVSDPNLLESQIDKDSDKSGQHLDSSISTLGASDEFSLSSTSPHDQEENLLESVNSAFKRLGEKYALQSGMLGTATEDENKQDLESEILDGKQDVLMRRARKVNVTDRKHPTDAGSVKHSHRTEASIKVSTNAQTENQQQVAPVPLPKRTVRKLAREYSRRAKSLERPSTLVKHRSEPAIKRQGESAESDFMLREPKGDLAKKVQSLKKALDESKIAHATDLPRTTTALQSDSSTSDDDKNRLPMQAADVGSNRSRNRKTVHDTVKQYESLSPKRSIEPKVITPNAGMSIQQRLRTIQESSDNFRRSKSMDRSHFDTRISSPSRGSPLKSLRERKLELEEWATRPITRGRYKSEGAFLGVACSDAISNDSNSEGKDGEVFSSRSSHTSSVQSSESASPLPQRSGGISRRWSSHSSSLSEEDTVLFKSIKDRFRELEIAVSKPVPRTCKDAREEIKSIAKTEKHKSEETEDDPEDDPARLQYEQVSTEEERPDESVLVFEEGKVNLLDATIGETDTDSIQLTQDIEEDAHERTVVDLEETMTADEDKDEVSGDTGTLKRSRAEELMRELNMLSMATSDDFEEPSSGTLKYSGNSEKNHDQTNAPTADTKDWIPIEEDPRSTSTQYSLELDFEETHLMEHSYQSTSSDDYCVPTRVTTKVNIDRDTRSEGGLSPERKPLALERVLSSDSNIFLDAKSDLGGSEDSSSLSGFVTPVESFSQE